MLSGFAGFVAGLANRADRRPVTTRATPKAERATEPTLAATEPEPPEELSAAIVAVEAVRFTNPAGREFAQLRVSWKNTGSRPARAVYARIEVVDEFGNELIGGTGGRGYPIFAVAESAPGVAPGETFTLPTGEGYLIPMQPAITRGTARYSVHITRVREDGY